MNVDTSLLHYFLNAGPVVKAVMLLLIAASILSWAFIIQRYFYLKSLRTKTQRFEQAFWSGEDLSRLFRQAEQARGALGGIESIFYAGFKEFLRFRKQGQTNIDALVANTKRAMNVAEMRAQDHLETHLSFLAMVASTSPYVGLFGTVWGIMQAFRALANVSQATIAMVAPGIAEALVATAIGLLAAIPAVIAYNRFVAEITQLTNRFSAFQEELVNILIRQSHVPQVPETNTSFNTQEYVE